MLLHSLLQLVPFAFAGGSAISSSTSVSKKRGNEYIAIVSYPNGPSTGTSSTRKFCLKNMGAAMAGLEICQKLDMTSSLSLFQLSEVTINGKLQQNKYTLKSLHDEFCVNFTQGSNPLYLSMAKCGSSGTVIPWFHSWKATSYAIPDKNFTPLTPKYQSISSPYTDFVGNTGLNLENHQCYYPNTEGGILLKTCQNSQQMTWFGYTTDQAPTDSTTSPENQLACKSFYNNIVKEQYSCSAVPDGIAIRGTSDPSTGRVNRNGDNSHISGLEIDRDFSIAFDVKIDRESNDNSFDNIFEYGYFQQNNKELKPIYEVGIVGKSKKSYIQLRSHNGLNTVSPNTAIPLNKVTKIKFLFKFPVTENGVSGQSIRVLFGDLKTWTDSARIFVPGAQFQLKKPNERFFASPSRNPGKSIATYATVGDFQVKFMDQGESDVVSPNVNDKANAIAASKAANKTADAADADLKAAKATYNAAVAASTSAQTKADAAAAAAAKAEKEKGTTAANRDKLKGVLAAAVLKVAAAQKKETNAIAAFTAAQANFQAANNKKKPELDVIKKAKKVQADNAIAAVKTAIAEQTKAEAEFQLAKFKAQAPERTKAASDAANNALTTAQKAAKTALDIFEVRKTTAKTARENANAAAAKVAQFN